jgi:hypothetical protein
MLMICSLYSVGKDGSNIFVAPFRSNNIPFAVYHIDSFYSKAFHAKILAEFDIFQRKRGMDVPLWLWHNKDVAVHPRNSERSNLL